MSSLLTIRIDLDRRLFDWRSCPPRRPIQLFGCFPAQLARVGIEDDGWIEAVRGV